MRQRISPLTSSSPVHVHDGEDAVYLGTAIFYGKTFDFWAERSPTMGKLIECRWSSKPMDCFSHPLNVITLLKDDTLYSYAVRLWVDYDGYMHDMCYDKWCDGEYPQ